MAVRRVRRGPTGAIYALVVFVFLFLIAGGLAIVFATQLQEERKSAEESAGDLAKWVKPDERIKKETIKLLQDAETGQRSALAHMQTEIASLKRVIAGSGDVESAQLVEQLAGKGVAEGKTVVSVLDSTKSQLGRTAAEVENLKGQVATKDAAVGDLQQKYDAMVGSHRQQLDTLKTEIAKFDEVNQTFRTEADRKHGELKKQFEAAQEKYAQDLRQREEQLEKQDAEISRLELRIKQVLAKYKREVPAVPDTTNEVDGEVVSINPDEGTVYINLGRADHLVPGMLFEVYDPVRGVQVTKSGDQLQRGKASIEVVELVSDHSALCRVVRGRAAVPVGPKDLIANLIYETDRKFKFYVFGEFDLDLDGRSTIADHDRVVELIESWGGDVTEATEREKRLAALLGESEASKQALPLDVDYLIIGREPPLPKPVPEFGTQEEIRAAIEAKKKWNRYIQLLNEAKTLTVPVINQNRFLALIGYIYQR
ncbi:MAG: hypothetical protein OER86_14355 [Phycisphaerae bacterium]|nr:hypothetical protein [Phycisphaerae bacterium]